MSSLCLFFFVMMNLKLIREEDFFSMKRSKFIKQAGALGAALATVSYTHLDVYKRQTTSSMFTNSSG